MKASPANTLPAIGERLRTQDNRMTEHPMFCVQELQRDYGYDSDYAEDWEWIDMESGDYQEVDADTPGAEKVYYKERWITVMVAFTESGCKEYLRLNGHNHRETRIYVESWFRCQEMIAVRNALIGLGVDENA